MESVIDQIEVNYWAVLVAGVAAFAFGAMWYGALAAPWMKAAGLTKKDTERFNKAAYLGTFLAELLIIYVLAHVVYLAEADTLLEGVSAGAWMWLGFVATTTAINYAYQMRPKNLYFIDAAHFLAVFVVAGAILGAWTP